MSIAKGNQKSVFDLTFHKLTDDGFQGCVFCISFGEETTEKTDNVEVIESNAIDETSKLRIEDLENDLKNTRVELQNLIEELESSNEEMQSSNEELMASNEELQSTNEELQSVNEELYTVNSELQEKNRELQYLNDDMNNLINSTHIGVLFLNNELVIRKFTPELTRHFNLQESDLGRPITSFTSNFSEDIRETMINDCKVVIDKLCTIEKEVVDKVGNNYLERINPYISSDKKIEGVVITLVNINNVKKIERNLESSEDKFRRIFEISPVGKYLMGVDGTLTVNESFCKMLNYKANEIKTWVEITYPDDVELTRSMIKKLNNNTESVKYKKRFVKNGGEIIWSEIRSIAQRDEGGNPINIISSVIDITDNMKIEMEVNRARQDAEISNMHKNYFLANMSHELRTPLNSVIGFSELLKDKDVAPEDTSNYVNIINDNANHLLSLINDIIDVAKIEADELKLIKKDFNIVTLLNEMKIMFDNYKLVNNKSGVNIQLQIPDSCDELYLHSDYDRLRQVFTNLLNNALKFSKAPSTITFGFQLKDKFLEFFVSDEGIGIPADQLEHIFGRFNQVSYNSNNNYGGTGLGLTICRGIVSGLGGRIWAESQLGKGSTFKFILPMESVSEDPKDDKSATHEDNYRMLFFGKKILVADDDASIRLYFDKVLKPTGVTLYFADNGSEAVEIYKQHQDVDIVLMDIQMPKKNGIDAFHEMREINPNVKVIAQTAFALEEEKRKYLANGFVTYLPKPIRREMLFLTLNKYM